MKLRNVTYGILGLALTFCACETGQGQSRTTREDTPEVVPDSQLIASYSFVDVAADTVFDPSGSLSGFYRKLGELDHLRLTAQVGGAGLGATGVQRVNIIHFGDSHIQAGSLTEALMRNFHLRFGNAGRGMIVPHKLSGSNEPRDYAIKSDGGRGRWEAMKVNSRGVGDLGITGVAIQSPVSENRLQICALPEAWEHESLNYSFNKVRIFHGKYAPMFEVDEQLSAELNAPDMIYDFNTDIELVKQVDSLEIKTYGEGHFARGPIYGFCLENGENGVLYHAMGVNGACFLHWARQMEVIRQTVALEPDLLILSMGSNEAAGANFVEGVFYQEIDRFVVQLRDANPEASIVLTSPPQAFRRGQPNPNFEKVSRILERYAGEKGVAYVDLYRMTGGAGSAGQWADHGLMGRDKIHYTPEGYRLQGALIYNALYKGYLDFHKRTE